MTDYQWQVAKNVRQAWREKCITRKQALNRLMHQCWFDNVAEALTFLMQSR